MNTAAIDDLTLEEAREQLRRQLDEGARCPCCTQFARVYHRAIHASMASGLIKLYRREPHGTYFEIATFMTHRELADFAKLAYWDLAAEQPSMRDDGSNRTGWWKITPLGIDFVEGRATVPKHARVYDGRCLGLTGKRVGIRERLGKTFDYAELMGAQERDLKALEQQQYVSPAPVVSDESGWTAPDRSPSRLDVGGQPSDSSETTGQARLAIFDEDDE